MHLWRVCRGAVVVMLAALAGCGSDKHAPAPVEVPEARCEVRLEPIDLDELAKPATHAVPVSRVVADVRFDASTLSSRLATLVPTRVASARNVNIGGAGKLAYHIDRSPFAVSVRDDTLHVTTRLVGHAEVCKPLGPLGCVSYGSCAPAADATASVPLVLRPNYRLGPASVSINITRPCHILGTDATPRIRQRAAVQAQRIRDRINGLLPSFEAEARSLWSVMGIVVPLGIESALYVEPLAVVQGPPTMQGSSITLPLGIEGHIVIAAQQRAARPATQLPPPRVEAALEHGVELNVAVEVDYESISAGLTRAVGGAVFDAGAHRVRVTSVNAVPDGDAVVLIASVSGSVCGELMFVAAPWFDPSSGALAMTDVRPSSRQRAATAQAPGFDVTKIAQALATSRVRAPVDLAAIPRGLDHAFDLLRSSDGPELRVRTSDSAVTSVAVTDSGVDVIVQTHGQAAVIVP